jgi:hypothetical protein
MYQLLVRVKSDHGEQTGSDSVRRSPKVESNQYCVNFDRISSKHEQSTIKSTRLIQSQIQN